MSLITHLFRYFKTLLDAKTQSYAARLPSIALDLGENAGVIACNRTEAFFSHCSTCLKALSPDDGKSSNDPIVFVCTADTAQIVFAAELNIAADKGA